MPVTLLKSCPNAMDQEEMYYKREENSFFFDSHLFLLEPMCPHSIRNVQNPTFFYNNINFLLP